MQNTVKIFLICIFLFSSCSKDEKVLQKASPEKTGLYSIELSPESATKNSVITVKVEGVKPSDLSYQWIVNDTEIEGAAKNVLKYPELKKNDRVQVKASIKGKEALVSDTLIISNMAPQIQSARFKPKNPKKGDELKVEVKTFDADKDNVSLLYEWFINGESVYETSDVLNTDELLIKRGDKVSVKITPDDGEQEGMPLTLYSIVANSPPEISPDIKTQFDGFVYTSKIIAEDPEGDPLTYTLVRAPAGMTIDSESGIITWKVTPKDKGEHDIVISVRDGHGSEVIVPLTTKISFALPE